MTGCVLTGPLSVQTYCRPVELPKTANRSKTEDDGLMADIMASLAKHAISPSSSFIEEEQCGMRFAGDGKNRGQKKSCKATFSRALQLYNFYI